MTSIVKVLLWNEEIGRLAWDNRRRISYFTYNPELVGKGIDVSHLVAPLKGINAMKQVWGEEPSAFHSFVINRYIS